MDEFLVDGILPANEAHLIGGASGSGKTTWLFQNFLNEFQHGRPVFDHASHPVPYVYVSLDRSRSSVTRTLERLGLAQAITRIVCLEDIPEKCLTLETVIPHALKSYPDAKLIVIEGFALMSGEKTNGYTAVGRLMRKAARLCTEKQLTIIGICHAPKLKSDEAFQHSREMLLGSVSWAAYSDTIIILNLDEATGNISIRVMPRNAAMETHGYVFGPNGCLVSLEASKPKEAVRLKIKALPFGEIVTRSIILRWAGDFKVSEPTADRVIRECITGGLLEHIEVGIYERTQKQGLSLVPSEHINLYD